MKLCDKPDSKKMKVLFELRWQLCDRTRQQDDESVTMNSDDNCVTNQTARIWKCNHELGRWLWDWTAKQEKRKCNHGLKQWKCCKVGLRTHVSDSLVFVPFLHAFPVGLVSSSDHPHEWQGWAPLDAANLFKFRTLCTGVWQTYFLFNFFLSFVYVCVCVCGGGGQGMCSGK